MPLPLQSPLLPMLARRADALPEGEGWLFEPKWDGFRVVVFKDGDAVHLQSRDAKPLTRYFPEVEAALRAQLPERCVLDGELVLIGAHGLDFEALQTRLHPAASRVKLLAEKTPAAVVFWDLLALGEENLSALPLSTRREKLLGLAAGFTAPVHLTPATLDRALATDWFSRFEGAGLDGVMAKRLEAPYAPNKRVMVKVKHERTCECLVTGFRWHKTAEQAVGSLMLALFDGAQRLHHVGVVGAFPMAKRKALVDFLAPYRAQPGEHPWAGWDDADDAQQVDGAQAAGAAPEAAKVARPARGEATSRWNPGKSLAWEPLRPELVLEVAYEHMQGTRFRHTAQFRRWRQDKRPADCTFAQLETTPPWELSRIFSHTP